MARVVVTSSIAYLDWREQIEPLGVHEGGTLLSAGLRYEPSATRRLGWAYEGRLFMGWAGYDGAYLFDPTTRATGVSNWLGTAHQGEMRYGMNGAVDGLLSLVLDGWRRRLGSRQQETYRVASVRLGLEGRPTGGHASWAGGGLELPIWEEEDAHFIDLGFDQNPMLKPGRRLGGFARFAHRFDDHWTWIGEWSMRRLGASGGEPLTRDGRPVGQSFQPTTVMNTIGVRVEYRIAPRGESVTPPRRERSGGR
jgi:hypothetical protein